jgi:hypothetical protein
VLRVVNKVEYTKYRQGLSIVHRNSPTAGLMEREVAVTTARLKMAAASLLGLLALATASGAQERPVQPPLRRVLLLPPAAPGAGVQAWIASERAAIAQTSRRGGLLGLFSRRPAPPGDPTGKKTGGGKPAPRPEATPEQLHAWCETLFYADLATRLRTKRHLDLPLEAEVRAALTALHMTPAALRTDSGLRRLGRELECDAVLVADLPAPVLTEGTMRTVTLRGTLRLVRLDSSERPEEAVARGKSRRGSASPLVPATGLPFFGTEAAAHGMFLDGYSRTSVQLAVEAAQQAAALAAHALGTGEIAPFARPNERVALLPVPAPMEADALLFTTTGRRIAPAAVRNLPADLGSQFKPELSPLSGDEIVPVERSRAMLKQEGITAEALWRQDQPEVVRVQALGARLNVTYVLLAHITSVELQTGAPEAGQTFAMREARAEAVGALVRVSDGAVLWQDHATATMTLRPTEKNKTVSVDKHVVEQAEHFALIGLQRRFYDYRVHFEN